MLCGPLDKDIKDRRRKVFDDQQQLSLGHLGQVTNEGKPFFRSIKIHQDPSSSSGWPWLLFRDQEHPIKDLSFENRIHKFRRLFMFREFRTR